MTSEAEGPALGPESEEDAQVPPSDELPAKRPEALQNVKDARELKRTPAEQEPEPDLGNRTLSNLVRLRLFVTYFGHVADRQFSHNRAEARFAAHRKDSPRFYRFCVNFDIGVLVLALLFAFAIVGIAIFKTTLR